MVIKATMKTYTLSKVIIMQSLKAHALRVSEKKATLNLFSNEICKLSFLNMCENVKNSSVFMIYLTQLTIVQSFNLIG